MIEGRCPDTFHCSDGTCAYAAINNALLCIQSYAALITSLLSCLGAALIVCAYCAFKDLRKGTTLTIVTLLALADFGTAITGILGASLFIGYDHLVQKSEKECFFFDTTCQIQGFMFAWSQNCDFLWTSILSVHLFLVTTFNQSAWIHKLMPLYNIIAWMVPLTVALPLLFQGVVGYDPAFRWTCFLTWNTHSYKGMIYLWQVIVLLTTAMIFIGYTVILVYVSCKQTCRSRNSTAWRVNKRIFVILVAYIILRTPDAIQIILSIFVHKQVCSADRTQILEFVLATVEAVTDTSQGWVNCVLYIFLSPEMRKRMFVLPFRRAVSRYTKRHSGTHQLRTSEFAPLLDNTESTLSTRGRARERGESYISYPTEFPDPDEPSNVAKGEQQYIN